jgi:putative flippase GtrA
LVIARTNIVAQFFWYLLVGGSAFLADFLSFIGFLKIGLGVLSASALGFVVGTLVNYVLSRLLAFAGDRYGYGGEIIRLLIVAGVGLVLTTVLVWTFVELAGLSPLVAKSAAVVIVLAWNFSGRRLFVFRPEMPAATFRLTQVAIDGVGRAYGARRRRNASLAVLAENAAPEPCSIAAVQSPRPMSAVPGSSR